MVESSSLFHSLHGGKPPQKWPEVVHLLPCSSAFCPVADVEGQFVSPKHGVTLPLGKQAWAGIQRGWQCLSTVCLMISASSDIALTWYGGG